MQETKEKLCLNVSNNQVVSRGLFAPYQQQAHDINNMLQNDMRRELFKQYKLLQERAVISVKAKDRALEEAMRKTREIEICLRKALAEAEFFRKLSEQKTALSQDLACRLLEVKKREILMKKNSEKEFTEKAESSNGENVDFVLGMAVKRRRL